MLDVGLSNVKLNYGFKNILDGVTFQFNSGDKVAIVGENGTGKTSIFNLIAGTEKPTSGSVSKRKDATVGFLTQIPPEANTPISVRDFLRSVYGDIEQLQEQMCKLEYLMADPNISQVELDKVMNSYGRVQEAFLNKGGYEVEANIDKMAANLKVTELLNQDYSSLSGGQKTLVCLARLLLQKPNILLLDEPTNHLDIPTLGWLEDFIKGYSGSVVLVSHDRYFLDKTVNKIFAIDGGKIKNYYGNYSYYVEQRALEREVQEQTYITQQKKISNMEDTIRKNRTWGAQSSEKAYRVAKQLERRIDEMDKVERPKTQKDIALNFNQEFRSGKDVLKFEDVMFTYPGSEDILLCGASMNLEYQDKVCIIGNNGSGKSTVIKLILGELAPEDGQITFGSNVKVGYLPQHVHFEYEDVTVLEEFKKHFEGTLTRAYSALASFHFFGEEVNKKVSSLSGGEKVRLKFAELVQNNVNLLILDEPTNHLDVRNREILEEALSNFDGTLLFVSHDRYFINKVANRVVELEDGEFRNYLGNYDFYIEHTSKFSSEGLENDGPRKVLKR